jgi:Co/Zn/Cd efflux system component
MEGVVGIRQSHFWQHSSDTIIGNIHVQALPAASEQKIIQEVYASVLTVVYEGPVFISQIKIFIGHTN